jgi:hypothetical protein
MLLPGSTALILVPGIILTTLPAPPTPIPRFFETFSYLPPLNDNQIARQVDYIINNGWTPCLEFAAPDSAYTSNTNVVRIQNGATCVSGPCPAPPRRPLPNRLVTASAPFLGHLFACQQCQQHGDALITRHQLDPHMQIPINDRTQGHMPSHTPRMPATATLV